MSDIDAAVPAILRQRGHWRREARAAIGAAMVRASADGLDVRLAIDAAYPFDGRENWPYTIWLSERRRAYIALGLMDAPDPPPPARVIRERERRAAMLAAGQVDMFAETLP